jgi:hypothetical protein
VQAKRRLIYFALRGAVGIVLLSDVSFQTTYPVVYECGIMQAGLSPINASVITPFDLDATSEFWWSFPSLLTDQAVVTTILPLTCSGPSCLSYFLPGPMTAVLFDPNLPTIGKNNFSEANAYIVKDAPGYQIDYSSITANDPNLDDGDCKIYGMAWAALFICVKEVGNGIIGGI